MIHGEKNGWVHLFYFDGEEEGCGSGDAYERFDVAMEIAKEEFGVTEDDWTHIEEVREHCQQDWVTPTRIKGREVGQPRFGEPNNLELFLDGERVSLEKVKEIPKIVYKEDLV